LKEGSVINNLLLIQKYCPSSPPNGPYTIHKDDYLKLVNDIQANGGSPEVDNPVGQIRSIEKISQQSKLIEKVTNILNDYDLEMMQHSHDLDEVAEHIIRMLFVDNYIGRFSKPLETTKEQPIKYITMDDVSEEYPSVIEGVGNKIIYHKGMRFVLKQIG